MVSVTKRGIFVSKVLYIITTISLAERKTTIFTHTEYSATAPPPCDVSAAGEAHVKETPNHTYEDFKEKGSSSSSALLFFYSPLFIACSRLSSFLKLDEQTNSSLLLKYYLFSHSTATLLPLPLREWGWFTGSSTSLPLPISFCGCIYPGKMRIP